MAAYSIAVVAGSLRRDSFNMKLARAVVRLAPDDVAFTFAGIGDLPLYNQDDDTNQAPPVRRFKEQIATADGVLFVTPEYNRSIPGVLKNAIDHGSRPYGQSVWTGKPAGIMGISPGVLGTAMAQQHLRNVLAALDMPVMALPEVYLRATDGLFDADGAIGPASHGFMAGWMDRFLAFVRHNTNKA